MAMHPGSRRIARVYWRRDGRGGVFEALPTADKTNRNFYERYMKGEKMNANWVEPTDFEKSDD